MFNEIVKKIQFGDKVLELSTGKIARQAAGSVIVKLGKSVLMCTVCVGQVVKNASFLPLTVQYLERSFAAGKIPSGSAKKDGKQSEREILISRLIDKAIRPLFHKYFFNEVQVVCTVLSYDNETNIDILALIGTSAALAISQVPFRPIAAAKVGFIDNKFVLNPSVTSLRQNSKFELIVAGDNNSVTLVTAEAGNNITDEVLLNAIKFGCESYKDVVTLINDLHATVGKAKMHVTELFSNDFINEISCSVHEQLSSVLTTTKSKHERSCKLQHILEFLFQHFAERLNTGAATKFQIETAFLLIESQILRNNILNKNLRLDGRRASDIRPIACDIGVLPKANGSCVFTRGETQSLSVVTLGTHNDEQVVNGPDGIYRERFMLQYVFPPYAVGETTPIKPCSRREIGHSKLIWRSIRSVLPSKNEFPYSIMITSETTESNGSSSMAAVCSSALALIDAGVHIDMPAGIAMGLIKNGSDVVVLSDISADEDYFGDVDCKIAATANGITACQIDVKNDVTIEMLGLIFAQAKIDLDRILGIMHDVAPPLKNINKPVQLTKQIKIEKNKIKYVIGSGGKVIRAICSEYDVKVDIDDNGNVLVSSEKQDNIDAAIDRVCAIIYTPKVDDVFLSTVTKIADNGIFINYLDNRSGFVHFSEVSTDKMRGSNVGDSMNVKVVGFDNKGRVRFTTRFRENNDRDNNGNMIKEKKYFL